MSEAEILLSIIKFLIKAKYIKSVYDTNYINYTRNIIKDLWEKLINIKDENSLWSIREIEYINIMVFYYTKTDELIELSEYTENQIKNYYRKNKLSDEEYKIIFL